MFFLHLLVDPPKTLKQIAIYLLRKMFNSFNCKNIYLVFDKVVSLSIKDLEKTRDRLQDRICLRSLDQLRHGQLIGKQLWKWILSKLHLSNSSSHIGENDKLFPFFENKQLFVNCEDRWFKFFAAGNCVFKAEVEELALHVLNGCDYTVSFSRKGKMRPFNHLEKNEIAQETFGCLGDVEEINESMLNVCKEFVC